MAGPLIRMITKSATKRARQLLKGGKKSTRDVAAQKQRKVEGKQAAALDQPAGGSVGQTAEQVDTGIPAFKQEAKKATDFDKTLVKKENRLAKLRSQANSITNRKDKIAFIAKNKTEIDSLKASIKDMKSRGGPGGKSNIKYNKKKGGGMTGEGLYPAEEARSGIMSQVRRKKYMKKGGKVISYKMTGGQVVGAGYD
jgi:hypothetical protein